MELKTVLVAAIVTVILAPGIAVAQKGRISIWDGVYTEPQAERGRVLYRQSCSGCHGADLWSADSCPTGLVQHWMRYSIMSVPQCQCIILAR
jgi:cytochrome c5